jgi:hypothetical protein
VSRSELPGLNEDFDITTGGQTLRWRKHFPRIWKRAVRGMYNLKITKRWDTVLNSRTTK